MHVEIRIDESCTEPKIIIEAPSMSNEISELVRRLSDSPARLIAGVQDRQAQVLEPKDIIRVYAGAGKVRAVTDGGEYDVRLRLYEIEERLDSKDFVRISHSEIVNLKHVSCFDLSLSGTICVRLSNGDVTYVSRRYVRKLKERLGL